VLKQVRAQYNTTDQAQLALLQLKPTARDGGDYATVTKRLAKVMQKLQHDTPAPLRYISSSSVESVPEPIDFYKRTFNFIDRIDTFNSSLEWPTKVCDAFMLQLIYALRLAIVNIHAVLQEYKAQQQDPANVFRATEQQESTPAASTGTRVVDTLARVQTDMLNFEAVSCGAKRFEAALTGSKRSAISTTVSSDDSRARKKMRV
jgi:hypothetical protein